MEADKSSLSSVRCRPRKAGGVIWSESKCLRTRGASAVNPSPREREKWDEIFPLEQCFRKKGANFSFLPMFVLSRPSRVWGGQATSPSLPIQILVASRNTLTDTLRNTWPEIWAPPHTDKLTIQMHHHELFGITGCDAAFLQSICSVFSFNLPASSFDLHMTLLVDRHCPSFQVKHTEAWQVVAFPREWMEDQN